MDFKKDFKFVRDNLKLDEKFFNEADADHIDLAIRNLNNAEEELRLVINTAKKHGGKNNETWGQNENI